MWFPEALIGKPRLRQPERPKKKMVKDCMCLTGVTHPEDSLVLPSSLLCELDKKGGIYISVEL